MSGAGGAIIAGKYLARSAVPFVEEALPYMAEGAIAFA